MLPFPLILAGAALVFGAITAARQEREKKKRLPNTGPATGDTGWPWTKEPFCLVSKSPGSTSRGVVVGPYQLTQSGARNWMLDHMENQPMREWSLLVYRSGFWQRTT
jgi:hypothetical protein